MAVGGRDKRKCAVVAGRHESIEHPSVGERDDRHPVVAVHHAAGVDDVLEQVVDVRAVAAGEVGADRLTRPEELVAPATRLVVDRPAPGRVGHRQHGRLQRFLERVDPLPLLRRRLGDAAPVALDAGVECGIAERTDLPQVVGGDGIAGNFSGGNGVEQGGGERPPRGEDADELGPRWADKPAVGGDERLRHLCVVAPREPLRGQRIESPITEQSQADAANTVAPLSHECFKCREAEARIRLLVEDEPADLIDCAAIAEDRREITDDRGPRGVGLCQLRSEGIPAYGLGGPPPAGEAIGDPREQVLLDVFVVCARDDGDKPFHSLGVVFDQAREPSGDQPLRLRPPRCDGHVSRPTWIRLDYRDQAIPDEQRQVVVVGIFAAGHQRSSEVSTAVHGHALECRGEGKPHQTAWVVHCECVEVGGNGVAGLCHAGGRFLRDGRRSDDAVDRPVVAEQANTPGPQMLVGVGEEAAKQCLVAAAAGMQREHGATGDDRVGRCGEPS